MAVTGLRLFAVTAAARDAGGAPPLDASVVRTRDLAALVRPAPYEPVDAGPAEVELYRRVVEAAFAHGVVLPAPCGTTFRNTEQLRRWMEQNYIALSEGMQFVAGRCEGRTHVRRSDPADDEQPPPASSTELTDVFRRLRRVAVAATTLAPAGPGTALSAAFLLERERWSDFESAAHALSQRHQGLDVAVTGPWPPYDFVRLDFGV